MSDAAGNFYVTSLISLLASTSCLSLYVLYGTQVDVKEIIKKLVVFLALTFEFSITTVPFRVYGEKKKVHAAKCYLEIW